MGSVGLEKNLEFWHWYPRILVEGLSEEQLRWQPDSNDTSITFAIWHAYRAEDEIMHNMAIGRPTVFARDGWADRLPVDDPGDTPFGNGLSRTQVAALRLDMPALLDYADAVGRSIAAYASDLDDREAEASVPLPFFTGVYPMLDTMTKGEMVAFFSIGHVSEHLGEVQYIKGLLGLKGAPL
jgi:hypothetical protein